MKVVDAEAYASILLRDEDYGECPFYFGGVSHTGILHLLNFLALKVPLIGTGSVRDGVYGRCSGGIQNDSVLS